MAKKVYDENNNIVIRNEKEVYKSSTPDAIVKSVDLEKRTMSMRGTTETRDRDGDIISLKGWDFTNYRKNPVILFGHDYSSVPIAGATALKVGDTGVDFDIQYPSKGLYPFADMILGLYYEKIMNASSVGFLPSEWEPHEEKGEGVRFTKQELLELSKVGVPSNPDALQLSIKNTKSFGDKVEPTCIDNFCFYLENNDKKSIDCLMPEEKDIDSIYGEIFSKNMKLEERKSGLFIPVSIEFDTNKEISRSIMPEIEKGLISIERDDKEVIQTDVGGLVVPKEISGKLMEVADEDTLNYRKAVSPFKNFDVTEVDVPPATFNYDLWTKFLDCEVKDIYMTPHFVRIVNLGNYLSAFEDVMEQDYELLDVRNFNGDQSESPIYRENIILNPEKSRDFIVGAVKYYKKKDTKEKIIVKLNPRWGGVDVTFITDNNGVDNTRKVLKDSHEYVKKNNFLKGWAFSIQGGFLNYNEANWDDVILPEKIKTPLLKSAKRFDSDNKELSDGRGLMFIGPPGTGKTFSGRTLMNDMKGTTFIWLSAKDMMYGGSYCISEAYDLGRSLAPSIIFMEDMDSWIRDNVVDLMKIEMDGLVENKGVLTILTSNNPEKFPEALIDRPGRFHEILNFDYPDKVTREEMIMKWTGADVKSIHMKTLNELVLKTDKFSGAHIRELVNFALTISKEEDIDIDKALIKSLNKTLEQRELIASIRQDTKSINKSLVKAGAVLNKKNKALLNIAKENILKVLDNAGESDDSNITDNNSLPSQESDKAMNTKSGLYDAIFEEKKDPEVSNNSNKKEQDVENEKIIKLTEVVGQFNKILEIT